MVSAYTQSRPTSHTTWLFCLSFSTLSFPCSLAQMFLRANWSDSFFILTNQYSLYLLDDTSMHFLLGRSIISYNPNQYSMTLSNTFSFLSILLLLSCKLHHLLSSRSPPLLVHKMPHAYYQLPPISPLTPKPNVTAKWLTLLHIQEVQGSNLGVENSYPAWVFCGFPESLQANGGTVL